MNALVDLSDKRILVTGASSGLGRATAVLLDRLGASVVLCGRNIERLAQTDAMMSHPQRRMESFDLRSLEAIPTWLKMIAEGGKLAGLVHCAGIQETRPLRMLSPESFEDVWRINVGAAAMLAKGFRQKQVRTEDSSNLCSLVLVASVMGLAGAPALAAYSASKGAIVALARSLALELAKERIRVNAVAPGLVRTEMGEQVEKMLPSDQIAAIEAQHPLGLGEPGDIAGAIAFLLSDAAKWITGTTLVVDGGYTAH
jgi:NAD(P)-dependent dehydrogenase (short-subunit alcohol dehydrogenase family)